MFCVDSEQNQKFIRERAYQLWVAGGKPEGDAFSKYFWEMAKKQLVDESIPDIRDCRIDWSSKDRPMNDWEWDKR